MTSKVKDPLYNSVLGGLVNRGIGENIYDKKIYNIRIAMINNRCLNSDHISYKSYGAKGVTICDRWLTYANFAEDFIKLPGYEEYLAASDYDKKQFHLDKDSLQ